MLSSFYVVVISRKGNENSGNWLFLLPTFCMFSRELKITNQLEGYTNHRGDALRIMPRNT